MRVPISLWHGKESRYFYTRHSNNNDRWIIEFFFRLISQRDEMLEDLSTIRLQLDTKQGIEANQVKESYKRS